MWNILLSDLRHVVHVANISAYIMLTCSLVVVSQIGGIW